MNDIKKQNIKNYYKNKFINKKIINNYHKEVNEDIIKKIFNNISKRIFKKLKQKNINRTFKYKQLLGCELLEFELELINKFKDGMTFNNYGEWEIDHIKPISLFNLSDEKELLECCNYKNLQPLWKYENQIKSNNYNVSE